LGGLLDLVLLTLAERLILAEGGIGE
jgi:hypothetical protein